MQAQVQTAKLVRVALMVQMAHWMALEKLASVEKLA
jgi:hypothetical protein